MTKSTEWSVRDGSRRVQFTGVRLAEISSQRPNSPRWTEMELYYSDTNKYILSKVGRSCVIHQPGCPAIMGTLKKFVDEFPRDDPDLPPWDMHTCIGETYALDTLLVEQTRFWAFVADSAHDIIDSLHRKDEGVRYLPRMAANLLEEAARHDAALEAAFRVEQV